MQALFLFNSIIYFVSELINYKKAISSNLALDIASLVRRIGMTKPPVKLGVGKNS